LSNTAPVKRHVNHRAAMASARIFHWFAYGGVYCARRRRLLQANGAWMEGDDFNIVNLRLGSRREWSAVHDEFVVAFAERFIQT
jgi:hypothetical protein